MNTHLFFVMRNKVIVKLQTKRNVQTAFAICTLIEFSFDKLF